MKRNQKILLLILALTTTLGGYALYVLLQLPERMEWFQLYGLLFYILLFATVYILILTAIGVVARLLKKDISNAVFNGMKWSILILAITIGTGIFSGQRKVSETEKQMEAEWKNR